MTHILTGLISAAIGAAVAWSFAFDMGWDAAKHQHAEECTREQDAAFERGTLYGRGCALADVHEARSVAAKEAAKTRAENRKRGEMLRAAFDVDAPGATFTDATATDDALVEDVVFRDAEAA